MSSNSFRITARVPVVVRADDNTIFCNSTKGYRLYLQEAATGYKIVVEEHIGAVSKPNPHRRENPADKWIIEAL